MWRQPEEERQRHKVTHRQAEWDSEGRRARYRDRHLEKSKGAPAQGRQSRPGGSRAAVSRGETRPQPLGVLSFLLEKEQRKPERNARNTDHSHQPLLTKHVLRAAPGPDPGLGALPPWPSPNK